MDFIDTESVMCNGDIESDIWELFDDLHEVTKVGVILILCNDILFAWLHVENTKGMS